MDTTPSLFCFVFCRDRPLGGGGGDGAVDEVVVLTKTDARLHVGWVEAQQVDKFLGELLIHLFEDVRMRMRWKCKSMCGTLLVALGGLGRLKEKVEEVKFNWVRAE